jgi:hypothetical protein
VYWAYLTGTDTGGSAIVSYELDINDGAGGTTFTAEVGFLTPYTLNNILLSTSITSGATYVFKYRDQNIFGWGLFSPETSLIAATTPDSPC